MDYKNYMLFGLGLFGIIIHLLVKINDINKKENGNFKFFPFIRLEWPAILLSLCVVIVAIMAKHEIKQLDQVSNWLGLAFVSIGYMAQSIVYKFMGRAEKKLAQVTESEEKTA